MKRQGLLRAGLALVVGLGVTAGLVRAQEPAYYIQNGRQIPVVGFAQPVAITPAELLMMDHVPQQAPPRRHPIKEYFQLKYQSHPCYCYADHNTLHSGTAKSECVFLFGSSRKFFNEQCEKGDDWPLPGYKSFYSPDGTYRGNR